MFSKLKHLDIPLLAAMLLLLILGLSMLFSTTLTAGSAAFFYKQFIYAIVGLGVFFTLSLFDYHNISKINRIVYVVMLLVLLYLLLLGPQIRGGRRWIDLGIGTFQPAEFVKISVIVGLARMLHLRRGQINSIKVLLWSLAFTLLPVGLIILEPDLGSALVVMGIWCGLIVVSPISKKLVGTLILIGLILTGLTWQFALKDFQKDRIQVFLDPSLDPRGRGYNVRQATIAIGSGQWWGKGFGQGLQSQNRFLPEKQTDFIFAASSEEIGFFGSFGLLLLYFFICIRILRIARRARDDLGMYIAIGTFFMLFYHILVNIGMNMGILPVTGIPLPFMSAGGSSLITVLIALGIVQNVAIQSKILRF